MNNKNDLKAVKAITAGWRIGHHVQQMETAIAGGGYARQDFAPIVAAVLDLILGSRRGWRLSINSVAAVLNMDRSTVARAMRRITSSGLAQRVGFGSWQPLPLGLKIRAAALRRSDTPLPHNAPIVDNPRKPHRSKRPRPYTPPQCPPQKCHTKENQPREVNQIRQLRVVREVPDYRAAAAADYRAQAADVARDEGATPEQAARAWAQCEKQRAAKGDARPVYPGFFRCVLRGMMGGAKPQAEDDGGRVARARIERTYIPRWLDDFAARGGYDLSRVASKLESAVSSGRRLCDAFTSWAAFDDCKAAA